MVPPGRDRRGADLRLMAESRSGTYACVIGNLLVDLILRGVEDLPEWGREVVAGNHQAASAGQAFNLACGMAALGLRVSVIGIVGSDEAGSRIVRDLNAAGVAVDDIEVSHKGSTGISIALVRPDGERAFVSDFASLAEFDQALVTRHREVARRAKVVCLVGLFNLPSLDLAAAKRVLAAARADGNKTVLDTGWDPGNWADHTVDLVRSMLGEVDIFLPNAEEAMAVTGKTDAMAAARSLEESCRGGLVVVKRGAEGSVAIRRGVLYEAPALPVRVQDTVGAGDVFNAGFLYAHSNGWDLPLTLAFANATAATYISRIQERFPSASEVLEAGELRA